jgi:hypothetical protein
MNIVPVDFVDRDCGDEAMVLVRVMDDLVGLALSLKPWHDGGVLGALTPPA